MADIAGLIGAGAQAVGAIGSLIGGRKDKLNAEQSALKSWQRNYEAQKEFAQNSIQWRVQDAKNAGINPYAAIGGQTAGYTPQDTSYQSNYQAGVSRAMNHISEAMGQLNLAGVAEDVKGKKLDNEKKTLDLINKAHEANMGNTSVTLKQPWFKTVTPLVKEVDGFKVRTQTDGSQVLTSNADDVDLLNIQNIRDMLDAVFGVRGYDALKTANGGKGDVALTPLGNRYYPHGNPHVSPAAVRAADTQRKHGLLSGLLSIPWHGYKIYSEEAEEYRRKHPPKNILDKQKLKKWSWR